MDLKFVVTVCFFLVLVAYVLKRHSVKYSVFVLLFLHIYKDNRCIDHYEIIDLPYTPEFVHNYLQDGMWFKWELVFDNNYFDDRILKKLERFRGKHFTALGAGGGGPEPFIVQRMGQNTSVELTDLHPNVKRYERIQKQFGSVKVSYRDTAVDMLDLKSVTDAVTICGTLHHFNEEFIIAFFEHVIRNRNSIFILDGKASLKNILLHPLRGFSMMFVGNLYYSLVQFDLIRLFLTLSFILPIIQAHDVLISDLRFYSKSQLQSIIFKVDGNEKYEWDFMEDIDDMSVLIAYPKDENTNTCLND